MIQRIMYEIHRIEKVTGSRAASVYLGKDDFGRLRDSLEALTHVNYQPENGRAKVCGLDIFKVDADNHFNVS